MITSNAMAPLHDLAILAMLVILSGILTWSVSRSLYLKRMAALQQERARLAAQNQHLEQLFAREQHRAEESIAARLTLIQQKATLESRIEALQSQIANIEGYHSELKALRLQSAQRQTQWNAKEIALTKDLALAHRQLEESKHLREDLKQVYGQLSAQALQENSRVLIQQAEQTFAKYWQGARQDLTYQAQTVQHTIAPLQAALKQYEAHLSELETSRQKAYGGLLERLGGLAQAQLNLERETARLIQSLRTPQVKGRWGELSLKRAVEIAGLARYCDFFEQPHQRPNDRETEIRPDMIIRLPQRRTIVIDAKVSLSAYLDAHAAEDPQRQQRLLKKHAQQLRLHVKSLSAKAYWRQFDSAPDFVVMFIPGESFFSAALEVDPHLIDDASRKNVLITTPTTLISLLKTVAYAWYQNQAGNNAKQILEAAKTLYERIETLSTHFSNLGQDLNRCIRSYNRTVSSYERRLLVSARRLRHLGIGETEHPPPSAPPRLDEALRPPGSEHMINIENEETHHADKTLS